MSPAARNPRPRIGWSAVVGACLAALALGACRSTTAAAQAVLSPVLGLFNSRDLDDCEGHAPAVAPPPAASIARTLRIGSWNVYYLGPSDETPQERRDLSRMAAYVRTSGVCALALQEIGVPADSGGRGSPTLGALMGLLDRETGGDWTYRVCGSDADRSQWIALAWDRRVLTQEGGAMIVPVEGERAAPLPFVPFGVGTDAWSRRPFAVKLSAGPGLSDFVFVPVHLTARFETFFLVEDATAIREEEGTSLAVRLRDVRRRFADDDVVVLGDFNTDLVTESVTEDLAAQGLRDLNCMDLATHEWGFALDRILVPRHEPEFALSRISLTMPPDGMAWAEFHDELSDHLMVVCEILVTPDDD